MRRRAFTLLELMISVSLGMLIVYVAVAGFRTAARAITTTNQLAIENSILRAACQVANERLDFWTDYDDPDSLDPEGTGARKLRILDATGGLPFTPMSRVFTRARNDDAELRRGWDPQEPWKASDPRTWFHGNFAEKYRSEMALGRYSIFSNSQPPVLVIGSNSGNGLGGYGTVSVPHQWYNRQVWGLHNALGFYGFTDYMPQNTLFACYQQFQNPMWPFLGTNEDGMPLLLFRPGTDFDNGEGGQEYPKGLWRLTMASSFAVLAPGNPASTSSQAHRKRFHTGYQEALVTRIERLQTFMDATENRNLLLAGPQHWPVVRVTTQHFIKTGRFIDLCKVRLEHPITGAITEFAFTGFSTTLRGARQQRRHPDDPQYVTSKWFDHDNASTIQVGMTLDDAP